MDVSKNTIDSHVHICEWDNNICKAVEQSSVKQFWAMNTGFTENGDNILLQAANDLPGTIIPFLCLDWQKFEQDPNEVDRAFERGAFGLKAIRPPKSYDDPGYFPIYQRAAALGMPILFHTGIIMHFDYKAEEQYKRCHGPSNMEPAMLGAIAAGFPDIQLIGGHLGYPYTEQTHHNLYYYNNIAHDISGYVPWEWLIKNLNSVSCEYHDGAKFYYEKILFATDVPISSDLNNMQIIEERNIFWSYFFDFVGNKYSWGKHKDEVMFKNAQRIYDVAVQKQQKHR